jgi:predicted regulator of Ras-like GTPase activity (Roadblock/LC7/MglB family)
MQTEALREILHELQIQIDGLEQMTVVAGDGTVLADLASGAQTVALERVVAELVGLADDVCGAAARGPCTEAIVKGEQRFLAVYRSQQANAVLGIVGLASVNFGLLNSGGRHAMHKIERLT